MFTNRELAWMVIVLAVVTILAWLLLGWAMNTQAQVCGSNQAYRVVETILSYRKTKCIYSPRTSRPTRESLETLCMHLNPGQTLINAARDGQGRIKCVYLYFNQE